ncbi:hypothetical protein HY496_02145 [Candidatus Woesearchaeota archaeon]|nr:hypothetical protein [Candidatus Woesearchaeota archaeon]
MNITKGSIHLYFCFEVASEIALEKVERSQQVMGKSFVFSLLEYRRLTPKYIKYKTPPLMVNVGSITIGGEDFEVIAKIYDFGVITIKFILPIAPTLDGVVVQSQKLVENSELQKNAEAIVRKVSRAIQYALVKPYSELEWEDYSIFVVNAVNQRLLAKDVPVRYRRPLAAILRSEQNLSDQEIADALKTPLSYTQNDLVLIDWNAAFIYEPEISYDVLDALEYAMIELLELRTYDNLLDVVLDQAYDDIGKGRKKVFFGLASFDKTLNRLYKIKVDISSFIDKVENALKLVGDIYLARVYTTAANRFHLQNWKNSVKEKLTTVQNIYTMLQEEAGNQRMLILEVIIVVLFILDIALYFKS